METRKSIGTEWQQACPAAKGGVHVYRGPVVSVALYNDAMARIAELEDEVERLKSSSRGVIVNGEILP